MTKHWYLVFLWSVWRFQTLNVAAFNLDTKNVMQRNGDPESLFGFSIAFHQQLKPARRNLLLVGAPQSKHQNQKNVTGVVYQCDLTTVSERCQPIEFNNEEFLESRGIDKQWMGVRVRSQGPGKNVMTCAHRYQEWRLSPSNDIPNIVTGQCYLLGEDLQVQVENEDTKWRRVLCDDQRQRSHPRTHEWFAYCQQGHGAAFAKDNRSLLFGAPGAYLWKGLVRMEPLTEEEPYDEYARETGIEGTYNPKLIPIQRDSYLGFSIDSGMALIKKGELTIVSGAPRGGYSGQVTFITIDPVTKRNLSVEFVLSGPGLASSFGYDLAVVDLNGDGWEDLAVGAPQFFNESITVGGTVYIYINNNGKNWETIKTIQLCGRGRKDSMFGLAVENIGDVNQDGYGDIAVGAPYDDSGRVYLYYGSSAGINKEAAQVLSPEPKSLTLFGYSLSGNLDVDDNQYPDLAVGSLSDAVFVYRARPVISVDSYLTLTPNKIDIKEQCDKQRCHFTARACFTYRTHPTSFNPNLIIKYTFEADSGRRKLRPRVNFEGPSEGKLELPGQGREKCIDARLRLLRDIQDTLHNINVSVNVSLVSSDQTPRTSDNLPNITPILNHYMKKTTVSEIVLINKGCGSNNICHSKLALQYQFCSRNKSQDQDVFKSLEKKNGVAVFTPSDEDIALEITVTNRNGDDAHQSKLVIIPPDTLQYSSVVNIKASKTHVTCLADKKGTRIDCDLGNPFPRDAEVKLYVLFSTTGISLSTNSVNVTLQLETISAQTIQPVYALAKVIFELELRIHGLPRPSQVTYDKDLRVGSDIKTKDDIGPEVLFEFSIINLGRPLKSFANASLNIFWPKEDSAGKSLIKLIQINNEDGQPVQCSTVNEIKPLKHEKGRHEPSRKRREAEFQSLSTDGFSFLPKLRKYKTMNCSNGLKCVEIRCPLVGLDSTTQITLHSRLWNSTFTEDYSSLNYLDIVVEAFLDLTSSPENVGLKPEKPEKKVKLTVFFVRKDEYYKKVAWWIIFLTVIVGLLLLAVLGFLWWKRGCGHNKKLSHDGDPNAETAHLKG